MADRRSLIIAEDGFGINCIPSGKQLSRTPPMTQVKKTLDFLSDCEVADIFSGQAEMHFTPTQIQKTADQDRKSFNIPDRAKAGVRTPSRINIAFQLQSPESPHIGLTHYDPKSVLKGMKGYKLTETDHDFIESMKNEKLLKKLQADLAEVEKQLKTENMALAMTKAAIAMIEADMTKFPSIEETTSIGKVFLAMTMPSTELANLDARSLLALVKYEDVERVLMEKCNRVNQLEVEVENRQKVAINQMQLKRQNIQVMMNRLSNLTTELAKERETCKALEMEIAAAVGTKTEAPEEQQQYTAIHVMTKGESAETDLLVAPKKGNLKSSDSTSLAKNRGNRKLREISSTTKKQTKCAPARTADQKRPNSPEATATAQNFKELLPQKAESSRSKADVSETTTVPDSLVLRRSKRNVVGAADAIPTKVDQNTRQSKKPVGDSASTDALKMASQNTHGMAVSAATTRPKHGRAVKKASSSAGGVVKVEDNYLNPEKTLRSLKGKVSALKKIDSQMASQSSSTKKTVAPLKQQAKSSKVAVSSDEKINAVVTQKPEVRKSKRLANRN